jgi:pantoate--beta-alanine ligase
MSVDTRPLICKSRDKVRRLVRNAQADGKRVGVVLTMGALHEGHLSLVDACVARCDVCVVTVFVNPTQFGPGEDYARYPRDLDRDVGLLGPRDVDVLFAPTANEMYRADHSTVVQPPTVANRLEGVHRPGHFAGVATIVLKLLHSVPADCAFFGQKDYQQCAVIKHMLRDLDLPVEIVVCPTVRDADGLALSSRNQYLSAEQRQRALAISAALRGAQTLVAGGEKHAPTIRAAMEKTLAAGGIDRIDYVAIACPDSLRPVETIEHPAIALIAAHVGSTRLIDNWMLDPS